LAILLFYIQQESRAMQLCYGKENRAMPLKNLYMYRSNFTISW